MKNKQVTIKEMASFLSRAQATLQSREDQVKKLTQENDRLRRANDLNEESAVYWTRKACEWSWGEFFAGLIIGGGILIVYNMLGC